MYDILLVNPRTGTERYSIPQAPLNLLCLAAVLEKEGYSSKLLDMAVLKAGEEKTVISHAKNALCVGVSSMTGTQILNGLKVSRLVKEYDSSIPVIWGGVHPTLFPEQTVGNKYVDAVVRGEGEYTLLEVVKAIKSGKGFEGIRGTTYKVNGKIRSNPDREFCDMNELPLPAWHMINVEDYTKPSNYLNAKRVLPLHASRGCPYNCAFCYNILVNKRRFRAKNAEKTFEELKYIVDRYRLDGIQFREDNFCTDAKRIKRLSELVQSENMDIRINCALRADRFKDEELLSSLSKMGVCAIGMGAESGSPRMLSLIDKNISPEDIILSAEQSKKFGFKTIYSFIIGLPGETIKDLMMTLDIINKIKKINPECDVTNINIYTPYPGNKLYNIANSLGFRPPASLEEWGNFIWDNLNLPWVKDENIIKTINQVSIFALNEQALDKVRKRNLIFNFAGFTLQKVEKFRWNHRFWAAPYELRLVRFIRKQDENI